MARNMYTIHLVACIYIYDYEKCNLEAVIWKTSGFLFGTRRKSLPQKYALKPISNSRNYKYNPENVSAAVSDSEILVYMRMF